MPPLLPGHGLQAGAATSTHTLTFFIHHGPEIVPDEPTSPTSEPGQHSSAISIPRSRPAIPPRRSSKSILGYVTTKYTDGSSEADYSSPISSSPAESRQDGDTRRQTPFKRHLTGLGRRRAENNDAFRPLEREYTSTYRSGVWSFETSSAESAAQDAKANSDTFHDVPLGPPLGAHYLFNRPGSAILSSARGSQSQAASPERPCDGNDSLAVQHLEGSQIDGLLSNASKHLPKPSVHTEVALQIFGNGPMIAENEGSGHREPSFLSQTSSAPPSHSRIERVLDGSVSAGIAPEIPLELKHEIIAPQQTAHRVVDALQYADAQQSGPVAATQLDMYTEVHDESLHTALEPLGAPTAQTSLGATSETLETAAEESRGAFFESTIDNEQSELYERDMETPNQLHTHSVSRELLPIGVAARNAQLALEELPQILEPIHQLIFEEQSRTEGLRIAVNDNMLLRQKLRVAQQTISERDGQIARLMQTYSTGLQVKQTRESVSGHSAPGAVSATFDSAVETESPDWTPPKFTSRVPVYDHFEPDQRVNPRMRPSSPTRGRRLCPPDETDADEEFAEEENGGLHKNTGQSVFSGPLCHAEDLSSDTGTVIRHVDHDSRELYGDDGGPVIRHFELPLEKIVG
ncbi:hypothetical protein H2200_011559 [Cladophialophora chaetospira]|uniref:Uncharacterized protein n=1 Tax=Cladophialophora chaetospira TaxID=386627 RepID=A0AA38WZJ3_9EURO|nr:hypothetical protein H2200_011559 [Cladophialophora chaetospira]